jgi:hypothetical protein
VIQASGLSETEVDALLASGAAVQNN